MILKSQTLEGRTGHEVGRLLLEQLYREQTGQALPPLAYGPQGKPYFPDSPWHFSISHTPRRAFCVLARENIAIDAEELDRQISPKLARKILSPEEDAQFLEAADPRRALLTFWVLKEAAAKLTGRGLQGYPNHTAFSLSDPRVREIDGCLVAILTEKEEHPHAL